MDKQKSDKFKTYGSEFAEVLIYCRDQIGASNWDDFKWELKKRTGIIIKPGTWQHIAPVFHKKFSPSGEVLWTLELAGIFKFPNGEPVTASKLLAVYYGKCDTNGNPIEGIEDAEVSNPLSVQD
ncbi:MAG: hypothetical protein EBZ77_01825 [Chitinophagia bacterium]|nr:hypothetical protein [Chitinophagia bacterium]